VLALPPSESHHVRAPLEWCTPLDVAIEFALNGGCERERIVVMLVDAGVDNDGSTRCTWLCKTGDDQRVTLFLAADAIVHVHVLLTGGAEFDHEQLTLRGCWSCWCWLAVGIAKVRLDLVLVRHRALQVSGVHWSSLS
jgi:hypothetical protein